MNKINELSTTAKMSKQCLEDSERWFGDSSVVTGMRGLIHHSLALAGEVGEFCNVIKKVDRGSASLQDATTRHKAAMELTDCYVYLLNIAGILGIDLEASYKIVRANNEKRFKEQRRLREATQNDH